MGLGKDALYFNQRDATMFLLAQAAEVTQVTNASDWAQFGLAGIVIAAMFGVLVHMYNTHNSERKEWRDDVKHIAGKQQDSIDGFKTVVGDLTMAIKELVIRNEKKQ